MFRARYRTLSCNLTLRFINAYRAPISGPCTLTSPTKKPPLYPKNYTISSRKPALASHPHPEGNPRQAQTGGGSRGPAAAEALPRRRKRSERVCSPAVVRSKRRTAKGEAPPSSGGRMAFLRALAQQYRARKGTRAQNLNGAAGQKSRISYQLPCSL
jgi:hypothetical protein